MYYLVDFGSEEEQNKLIKNLLEKRGFKNKSKNWRDINKNLLNGDWNIGITTMNYIKKDNGKYYLWKIPKFKVKGKEIIRIINHYPNPECITNKANLTRNLKNIPSSSEFYKESHVITLNKQKIMLKSYMENILTFIDENIEEGVWITKISNLYEGLNTKIHKDKETLKNYFKNIVLENEIEEYIIQKYVKTPMLYDGRKFDIRVNVLLDKDFNIYIHEYSLMRISSSKYTTNDYEDQITHITNYVSKEDENPPNIVVKFDEKIIPKDLLMGLRNQFCHIINQVIPPLKEKLLEDKNNNFKNYYEHLGFDFIIEENEIDSKVFLLEININPGILGWRQKIKRKYLNSKKLLDDTFSIVIDPIFKIKTNRKNNGWLKIFDGRSNTPLLI